MLVAAPIFVLYYLIHQIKFHNWNFSCTYNEWHVRSASSLEKSNTTISWNKKINKKNGERDRQETLLPNTIMDQGMYRTLETQKHLHSVWPTRILPVTLCSSNVRHPQHIHPQILSFHNKHSCVPTSELLTRHTKLHIRLITQISTSCSALYGRSVRCSAALQNARWWTQPLE